MKKITYIILSLITVYTINAQDNRPSVAVLDFDAKGIASYEAETLTERLRSEIATTNAVRLTDRKLLEKILKEQGLQQSGCTTDECTAEVGQLLGAPVSAGIYFYQIQTSEYVKTRKMVILK